MAPICISLSAICIYTILPLCSSCSWLRLQQPLSDPKLRECPKDARSFLIAKDSRNQGP